jgi:hypothetical protein
VIVTPSHRRWGEFAIRLQRALECDQEVDGWGCKDDLALSALVLATMDIGHDDVRATLDYFKSSGGHCDCEVMFNVVIPAEVDLELPREDRDRLHHKRSER